MGQSGEEEAGLCLPGMGRLADRIWYVGIRGKPGYPSYTPLFAFLISEVLLSSACLYRH